MPITDEYIKKMLTDTYKYISQTYTSYIYVYIYMYIYIYISHKKNEILPFAATCMDLRSMILSEISDKDKYCMISLIRQI